MIFSMYSSSEIKQLRARWSESQIKTANAILLGQSADDDPFPVCADGSRDYRGLRIDLAGADIENIDLSCAYEDPSGGMLVKARCRNCRLMQAKFQYNLGDAFEDCDFRSVRISGSMFGTYDQCQFDLTNLRSAFTGLVRFTSCRFVGADFRRATFFQSEFIDCDFTACKFGRGSFAGSKFKRCRIDPDKLADDIMDDVVFEDCTK